MGQIYLLEIKCKKLKRYLVGQTKNFSNRLKCYKCSLSKKRNSNEKLQNCYNKYGWKAFKFSILENCSNSKLSSRERFYIKYFDTFETKHGMNLTSGGEKYKEVSEKTRRKIGDRHKNRKFSQSHKNKLKISRKGRKPALGMKHTKESKEKIIRSSGYSEFQIINLKNKKVIKGINRSEICKKIGCSRRELYRILKENHIYKNWKKL